MLNKTILLLLTIFISTTLCAQENNDSDTAHYPQDYFRNPLDIPIFLAGNFGECRPGHFHSGIDIKTMSEENHPVYAAASGYISRIKMENGGFGHALYVTHPNGYTTLYAHLNDFMPAVQQYLKDKQYEKQKWNVDLEIPPSMFPVEKGQQIAWSGNTGSSTAPHLHFEIRNTKTEHPLNPEQFGLPIIDHTAPVPSEVVLYSGNIYTDGNKTTLKLAQRGDKYVPVKTDNTWLTLHNDTTSVLPVLYGIGINVYDYMDGSDNTITFYSAKLYVDDSLQAAVILDDIGYDETRYINAYTDYKTKEQEHKWVQLLFQQPGNKLGHIFHHLNANNGTIDLAHGDMKKITIVIVDDKGNTSKIEFYTKVRTSIKIDGPKHPQGIDNNTNTVFTKAIDFKVGKANYLSMPNASFTLTESQLYDDMVFHYSETPDPKLYSDKFMLDHSYIPVHHYFDLHIKPKKPIPFKLRSKVVMMYDDGNNEDGRAASVIDNGLYQAAVRNFGTYWLAIDTTAPVIKLLQKKYENLSKADRISFVVTDDMTSVRSFGGQIDGKWVCFEQHNDLFFYKFDTHCPKGKHNLVFKAADENGNERTYKIRFTR